MLALGKGNVLGILLEKDLRWYPSEGIFLLFIEYLLKTPHTIVIVLSPIVKNNYRGMWWTKG